MASRLIYHGSLTAGPSLAAFNRISTAVGNAAGSPITSGSWRACRNSIGGPWQVFDALGDLARERKDYEQAARLYQLALEDGSNETLTPDWMAPDEQYILRLDSWRARCALPRPARYSFPCAAAARSPSAA